MERAAVVGFAIVLLLICLYWTYGYIRRRSKKALLNTDRRDEPCIRRPKTTDRRDDP